MNSDSTSHQTNTQKWLSIAGTLLVILSFYYIGLQLWGYRETLLTWNPSILSIVALGAGVIIYALGNYFLAIAWVRLLRLCGEHHVSRRTLTQIYGKSQIGKYIPGNIAHIAGRHAMGKAAGVSHTYLAMASIFEIAGLVCAALGITLISGSAIFNHYYPLSWLPIIAPIVLLSYLLTPWFLHKIKPIFLEITPISMLTPLFYYLLFFLISGIALALLGMFTGYITLSTDSAVILSSFAIAWSIGFITPGAPSGIGIREAILLLLLTPLCGEGPALILSLLFRLVTIGGDIAFYAMSQFSTSREKTLLK